MNWGERLSLAVKLSVFEGPLELLLHLIDKNKVSIYDIPIATITEQYIAYLESMQEKNMDIMSEFIEMAATLISIKSKMLLPAVKNDEDEALDPRTELIEKLLEYKKFKVITSQLKGKQMDAEKMVFKSASIPLELLEKSSDVDVEALLTGIDLTKLYSIFTKLIKRQKNRFDPIRSKFGNIKKETFTVKDKMDEILKLREHKPMVSFTELLADAYSRVEMIVTFLAVLEMIKMGYVHIQQTALFDDITITFRDRRDNYAVK